MILQAIENKGVEHTVRRAILGRVGKYFPV